MIAQQVATVAGIGMILAVSLGALAEDFLPPAPPWRGNSERLIAGPDNPWITPAERTGLTDSPSYEDTVAWLRKLSDTSPRISMQTFGRTPQGRDLYLVIATKEGASNPDQLRANGRPTLLAQAGIHAGEIDGKDAGMMLLRDLALTGKAKLLDRANFLFVPVFNADGHERASRFNRPNQRGPVRQGWRTTAQNLNLNRDYVKTDTPEMQAMIQLLGNWQPSLYLDVHVTDGIDYQYDVTYGFHGWDGDFAWSPQIGVWLDRTLRPALDAGLKAAGHVPGPLVFSANHRDLSQGISLGPYDPRYSTGYGDLRHIPTVLVENHSLKPHRQRVLGTYVLMETSLEVLGQRAASLRAAVAADSAARPQRIPMNFSNGGGGRRTIEFLGIDYEEYDSPASGAKEVRWLGTPKTFPRLPVSITKPAVELRRPKAYWVPATKPEVIVRLRRHGVKMQTLRKPRALQVEMYRLVDPQPAAMPYEGRHLLKTGVTSETRTETFPPGSVRVSTDQPLGDLVVVMLEPESADSLLAWGFFSEILQRTEYIEGYVVAPMAEKMLADSPRLKAEFEARLASDKDFVADRRARLRWFYERSKFYDQRYLLYPVGLQR